MKYKHLALIFFVGIVCSSCVVNRTNELSQNKEQNLSEATDDLTDSVRGMVPKDVQAKLDAAKIKAKEKIVRHNIADLERAIYDWRDEHAKQFPPVIDNSMNSYLLKNTNKNPLLPTEYISGQGFVNPFTKKPEWPTIGYMTDVMTVRKSDPPPLPAGQIQYSHIINGEHYAILGGGADGKALTELYLQPQGCKTAVASDVFRLK